MRTHLLFKAAAVALILAACSSEENLTKTDDSGRNAKANSQSGLANLQREANAKLIQRFVFKSDQRTTTLTSKSGVLISFEANKFKVNGIPVTGPINVEFVEIFRAGNMVTANKTTMGIAEDVEQNPEDPQLRPLLTGGEFFINMTDQNGKKIDDGNLIKLTVPTALTQNEGQNPGGMTAWDGKIEDTNGDGAPDPEGDVTWDEKEDPNGNDTQVPVQNGNYIMGVTRFGWCNIDKLRENPGPKTTIYVQIPTGYNNTNSNCYLAFSSTSNSIVPLDRFNVSTNKFTEHYGQIPIGMSCYIILVSEQGGLWKYAIKPVVIAPNGQVVITNAEIQTGTEGSLTAAINSLP